MTMQPPVPIAAPLFTACLMSALALGGNAASAEEPAPSAPLVTAADPLIAWNGYEKQSVQCDGRAAFVIVPKIAAPGKPWVLRISNPDANPGADIELLRSGWHVACVDLPSPADSDRSLDAMDRFCSLARFRWSLSEKMALELQEGKGRVAERYRARHPERVACVVAAASGQDARGSRPSEAFRTARFVIDQSYPLPAGHEYFRLRDGMAESMERFEAEKRGRVVFLGGSITFNPGWRDEVMRYLRLRFPETRFEFVAAAIPSLGSVPHAFRLDRDVLSSGPIDLVFVEAAVNDHNYDDYPNRAKLALRGMEGVVRHLRVASPLTDIALLHFADDRDLKAYREGRASYVIEAHERVATAYGCPSLDLSREVGDRIEAHEFTWKDDFRDIHPSPYGQQVYSLSITRMLDAAFGAQVSPGTAAAARRPRSMEPPIDAFSYFNGRFGALTDVRRVRGFVLESSWKPADGMPTRDGFVSVPALVGTEPGAEFDFDFAGREAGLLVTSGPDAGIIEFSVDHGPWGQIDTFTPSSPYLHLPWALILADELPPGPHTIRVRISAAQNPKSIGHALRVQRLLLN